MSETQRSLWTFTGLTGIDLDGKVQVQLPEGFLLSAKTPQFAAVLDEGYIGSIQRMWWAARLDAFFCLRSAYSLPRTQEMDRFQDGLMAMQIIKPVPSLGLIFQADDYGGSLSHVSVQERPQMSAGDWAELRRFDNKLITQLDELMPKVLSLMRNGSAEQKNSVNLLQFSLEHLHPLIKGLFAVMGLEAVFDSKDRWEFKKSFAVAWVNRL